MMKINVQQLDHQQVTLDMKALRHGLTRWATIGPIKNMGKGSQAEASATS
tara:strand:+ start:112188 stop:112337 length:150 start_codon:yes stop_codon:yes gene_type:complete